MLASGFCIWMQGSITWRQSRAEDMSLEEKIKDLNLAHVDFEVSVSVWKSSVRSWMQLGRCKPFFWSLCCTNYVMSCSRWILRAFEILAFHGVRSLIFEIDMKELLPLSECMSLCAASGKKIFLWMDFGTYLPMSLLHFYLEKVMQEGHADPGAPSQRGLDLIM